MAIAAETATTSAFDDATVQRVVEFHGHMCPGLAMGIRAAEIAVREIGVNGARQEVTAIVENDMCGVDGIQFLTGCTFGKGNLVYKDHGKSVYTFVRSSDGRAVRLSLRPEGAGPRDTEWEGLFAKVRGKTASPPERERFQGLHLERARRIMAAPLGELYEVREVHVEPPVRMRSHSSVVCQACGESATRIRRLGDRDLCVPCFEEQQRSTV